MLLTKFRGNRSTGSGEKGCLKIFTIYGHGVHLGYAFSLPIEAPHKVWL